jgi:DnaJ-domain-containing protein 1
VSTPGVGDEGHWGRTPLLPRQRTMTALVPRPLGSRDSFITRGASHGGRREVLTRLLRMADDGNERSASPVFARSESDRRVARAVLFDLAMHGRGPSRKLGCIPSGTRKGRNLAQPGSDTQAYYVRQSCAFIRPTSNARAIAAAVANGPKGAGAMELLTAAFVTGTLLISFEGEEAGLALIAAAIAIVGYKTGGPGGVAETVKGMGSFGALIFWPCLIVLSWRATRKWLPERLCKRATTQQEAEMRPRRRQAARQQDAERGQQDAEMRREAARQRQAARQQYAERQRQAEREREQRQQAEIWREVARRRQRARQEYAERQRQAEREREREQQWQAERQRETERTRTAQQKPVNWWDLLGVSPNASMEEIARSYRRTIQKYHPDRVLGLAPEIVELAESRSKALNAAYDQAKRTLLASTQTAA